MEQAVLTAHAERPSLIKLLDSLSERPVIHIHAPAGFGKTVSALLWLEHRNSLSKAKRAWISLDEYDNNAAEFCFRFTQALASLQAENESLRELASNEYFGTAPAEFTLRALGMFAGEDTESILVLDDLHIISNHKILTLMPVLFWRLPKNCTVLLLSRNAPPDSLLDKAAKGELAVVAARHLQFSSQEAKTLFSKNGRHLSTRQADEIIASTGGWAIGIRALLLSEEEPHNISINNQYLNHFFKTHVWERWDWQLRKFMMLVSAAEELTPEFCKWLTSDEKLLRKVSCAGILNDLARENAFLREVSSNTYRFHDLFREFLMRMLGELGDKAVIRQWNKGGDYFFGRKDYYRAIAYYRRGKNDDGVAESLYHMYDHKGPYASIGETLYTIRSAVNDSIVETHPALLEVQAWAAWVEGRAAEFEEYADKYYLLFPKIVLQNPRSAVILVQFRCVDYRVAFIKTMKSLCRLPFKGNFQITTPSITNNAPLFHRSFRDFSELAVDAEKYLALFKKSLGGVLGEEYAVIKECLSAGFYYEKGDLGAAYRHSLAACANIQDGCSAEIMFCAMMIMASTLFAEGQNDDADKVLKSIRDMIEMKSAFYLDDNFRAFQSRLRLQDGDKDTAKEWLQDRSSGILDNLPFFRLYSHFTTARAHIVVGSYADAILHLQKLLQLCERYRRPLDIIEANILLAIAYWKKGRGQSSALSYLERAVLTAHEYGYIQMFANEGAELVNMLQRLQKRAVQGNYAGDIPAGFAKTVYISAVAGAKRFKGLTGGRTPENLSFTDKQKTVMRLLCEGCSRNDIAEKTGLKPYTVKSHIELVYRKLDVSNNVDAMIRIKELGVL